MSNPGNRRRIEQSRSTIDADSNWLITLADMMTLLMVFFVMFLLLKQIESRKRPVPVRGTAVAAARHAVSPDGPGKIKDALARSVRELGMANAVEVYTVNKDVVVNLKEDITFAPGKADIFDAAVPLIGKIANSIRTNPSYTVEIDGNTDNVPIHTSLYPSNWDLSMARAMSVLKCFVDRQGIDPSRFYITGNGDRRPLAPNDTPEERARNRRVEIRLKYNPGNSPGG